MSTVPHVLVVDDDKETCTLLSRFLERHGYRISVAHDGRAMMVALDGARIDAQLLSNVAVDGHAIAALPARDKRSF